jgi:hypothetical protein
MKLGAYAACLHDRPIEAAVEPIEAAVEPIEAAVEPIEAAVEQLSELGWDMT